MLTYKDWTALITGASKGLGSQFALQLAQHGANVVLVARSTEAMRRLAGDIVNRYGRRATVVAADLSDPNAPEALLRELDQQKLDIDLLVNNAGVGATGHFLANDLAREIGSIQVNIAALVALSHLLGQRMRQRGRGGIINIASNAAFQPLPYMATYAAAKAIVLHFTEALRHELKGSGVQVMAVAPGS